MRGGYRPWNQNWKGRNEDRKELMGRRKEFSLLGFLMKSKDKCPVGS